MQKCGQLQPFGLEMYNASKDNTALPVLFEDTFDDTYEVKKVKTLITYMTKSTPEDRIAIHDVATTFTELYSKHDLSFQFLL